MSPAACPPRTSNDNPFIEAHFKTAKYRPDYPDRFESLDQARTWMRRFAHWYNHDHTELKDETALLHTELKDDMAVLRTEMAAMELRIDDRMDERFRSMYGLTIGTNVATVVAVAMVIFAALRL
ncbi:MAG: transposase [Microthrixaceae bacterium]|nr:transposase [Microthrixaceae bacterium]